MYVCMARFQRRSRLSGRTLGNEVGWGGVSAFLFFGLLVVVVGSCAVCMHALKMAGEGNGLADRRYVDCETSGNKM